MLAGIQNRTLIHRAILVRRVAVVLLLLYFAVFVNTGSAVDGDFTNGFYFAE